jgi:hypothetical protein
MPLHLPYSYATDTYSSLETYSSLLSNQQSSLDTFPSLIDINNNRAEDLEENISSTLNSNYSPLTYSRYGLYSNAIINGGMEVAQRGTSISSPPDNSCTADRFIYKSSGGVTTTLSVIEDAPPSTYGLSKSLKVLCNTADATISSTDYCYISYSVEGCDARNFYGKTFTIGFWVKATLTGTYCIAFRNNAKVRSYVSEYTINVTNTWEYKTITCLHNNTGTWEATNLIGIEIDFTLTAGSDYKDGTNNAWVGTNELATTNQINCFISTNDAFQITGVQMNLGTTALPYIPRHYSKELEMCKRYYWAVAKETIAEVSLFMGTTVSTDIFRIIIHPAVEMRAIPTAIYQDLSDFIVYINGGTVASLTGIVINTASSNNTAFILDISKSSSFTKNQAGVLRITSATDGYFELDSEL